MRCYTFLLKNLNIVNESNGWRTVSHLRALFLEAAIYKYQLVFKNKQTERKPLKNLKKPNPYFHRKLPPQVKIEIKKTKKEKTEHYLFYPFHKYTHSLWAMPRAYDIKSYMGRKKLKNFSTQYRLGIWTWTSYVPKAMFWLGMHLTPEQSCFPKSHGQQTNISMKWSDH